MMRLSQNALFVVASVAKQSQKAWKNKGLLRHYVPRNDVLGYFTTAPWWKNGLDNKKAAVPFSPPAISSFSFFVHFSFFRPKDAFNILMSNGK